MSTVPRALKLILLLDAIMVGLYLLQGGEHGAGFTGFGIYLVLGFGVLAAAVWFIVWYVRKP